MEEAKKQGPSEFSNMSQTSTTLNEVYSTSHSFKTLTIGPVYWLQKLHWLIISHICVTNKTKRPRQVRELILDSDSWSQGVKGQAFRVPGGQG